MNRLGPRATGWFLLSLVAAAAILSFAASEPRSAFSGDRGGPLVETAESLGHDVERLVSTPAELSREDPARAALVVLDAPAPYDGEEVAAVREFVEAGGALLVADPQGHGTQLSIPAGLALERVRLNEPTGSINVELEGRSFRLSASNATAVKVEPNATANVRIHSDADSFLDRDGDGAIGRADPVGPFPILVWAPLGKGQVWVLSAPAALTDSPAQDADHAGFRELLLREFMGDRTRLAVDESRIGSGDPVVAASKVAVRSTASAFWQAALLLGAAAAALAGAWSRGHPVWGPHVFQPKRFLPRRPQTAAAATSGSGWTRRGWVALGLGAALAVCGPATSNSQASWAGAFFLAAAAGALLLRAPAGSGKRTVSAERVPESGSLHVAVDVRFRRLGAGVQVRDELGPSMEVTRGTSWTMATGRHVVMNYEFKPSRLGVYDVGPLVARRQDALALRNVQRLLQSPTPIRVTPRLEPARRTPFGSRIPDIIMGTHAARRAGAGTEFFALRDYQEGDPLRAVNWRASARSKTLVVNQRVHESPMDLTIFLDVRAASDIGPADATPFVVGARAAASVSAGAMRARDRVKVVLYGDGIRKIEGRGLNGQLGFEDALASTRPGGFVPLKDAVESALPDLRRGRPVLIVTGTEGDATIEESVQQLRKREVRPFLLCPKVWVSDGTSPDDRTVLEQRSAVLEGVRKRGFAVYELLDRLPLEDLFRVQGVPP